MNEIEARLTKYLDAIEGAVSKTSDFAAEQVPLAVQELVAWKFWEAVLYVSGFVALALVAAFVSRFLFRIAKSYDGKPDPEGVAIGARVFASILLAGVLVCLGFATVRTGPAIKCSVAPRLVVLEEIKTLVGGKK